MDSSETFDTRYAPRHHKAVKILEILRDGVGRELAHLDCLDLGCGAGAISRELAPHFRQMTGVDLDYAALKRASIDPTLPTNLHFAYSNGGRLPLADASVDVVLCAQVYEHTDNQWRMAGEILRVLRPGGVCFFSGPNRLAVMEEHYWLPFLSWLPRQWSSRYMRLFRRGSLYDITPRTLWELRSLWHAFEMHDYTLPMLAEPERFAVSDKVKQFDWVGRLPFPFPQLLLPLMPNFNFLLVKPHR